MFSIRVCIQVYVYLRRDFKSGSRGLVIFLEGDYELTMKSILHREF